KKSFLCCAILLTAGALCFLSCRAASSVELLLLGRLLVGLASGLTTGVIPMYLAEVSPIKLRGAMGVLCPLGLTVGVVVGQAISLEQVLGTEAHWHYALSCYAVLNLACYAFYFWIPESPKYLYSVKGDQAGSLRAIRKLFGRHSIGDDYIKLQMECAGTTINGQSMDDGQPSPPPPASRTLCSVLRDPSLTLPLVLVCALQGGQQLSGINAVQLFDLGPRPTAMALGSLSSWGSSTPWLYSLVAITSGGVIVTAITVPPTAPATVDTKVSLCFDTIGCRTRKSFVYPNAAS
uniref:Major facilitator superfamily (MFS) profile domain-containing protein n=1 Tax=Anopheles maculatus TaxID=74869 RepID=A0A182SY98_9DIPT